MGIRLKNVEMKIRKNVLKTGWKIFKKKFKKTLAFF